MKYKWFICIVSPWLPYIVSAIFATKFGFPTMEVRVMYTIGTLIMMGIMLAIVQPWREDRPVKR